MIETARLLLVPLEPAFYRCSIARDIPGAERALGFSVEPDWFAHTWLMEMRLKDLERDPSLQPWLLRGVVDRELGRMVGHIGFHTQPNAEYLRTLSPGGVELGYTIDPAHRRRGYAREAAIALMAWAHAAHQVPRFVASVSPENISSVNLVRSLGFVIIGGHNDELDGYEDIYERVGPAPTAL